MSAPAGTAGNLMAAPTRAGGAPAGRLRRALDLVPSARLALALVASALVLAAAALVPALLPAAVGLAVLVLAVAVLDRSRVCRFEALEVAREHDRVMSHGAAHTVRLRVRNRSARVARIELEEVWPDSVTPARVRIRLTVPAGGESETRYAVTPQRRGALAVAAAPLRSHGPWGLVARQRAHMVPASEVHVYPNIKGIARYELAARRHLVGQIGIRSVRRRGEGTEIEGLRDYTPDDEYRRIDWKATARRDRPIARQLRDEQAQTVYIMIDAGRLGAVAMRGATRLDFAVNAALVLAHVATVRGDRVGVLVFDRETRRHMLPVRASRAVIPRIARLLYDVAPAPVESDYGRAFELLAARHRRRGLVVLLTDLLSAVASEALIAHLGRSARRHLPVCVAIDDPVMREAAAEPLHTAGDVYRLAAAAELRHERDRALRSLRDRGVIVLDVPPENATPTVISSYLELKARRLL
jgi:uncharacterized protein (DUF58 family)